MRVLLADDQAEVRSALRLLLEQGAGLTVVGEAAEAGDLLAQARGLVPDLVLLDWELPGKPATDGTRPGECPLLVALRSCYPRPLVVVLSGRPEAQRAALAAGADAFVSKGDPPERLLTTLHALGIGE